MWNRLSRAKEFPSSFHTMEPLGDCVSPGWWRKNGADHRPPHEDGGERQQNRGAVRRHGGRDGGPCGADETRRGLFLDGQAANREPELDAVTSWHKSAFEHHPGSSYGYSNECPGQGNRGCCLCHRSLADCNRRNYAVVFPDKKQGYPYSQGPAGKLPDF